MPKDIHSTFIKKKKKGKRTGGVHGISLTDIVFVVALQHLPAGEILVVRVLAA